MQRDTAEEAEEARDRFAILYRRPGCLLGDLPSCDQMTPLEAGESPFGEGKDDQIERMLLLLDDEHGREPRSRSSTPSHQRLHLGTVRERDQFPKTVSVKSDRSSWDKRQATLVLYSFVDGVQRLKPKTIFHGAPNGNDYGGRGSPLFDRGGSRIQCNCYVQQ